jgi:hypothetical protein
MLDLPLYDILTLFIRTLEVLTHLPSTPTYPYI